MQHAKEELENPNSVLRRTSSRSVKELQNKLGNCRDGLEEVERLLKRFQSLDKRSQSRHLLDPLRFAIHDISRIRDQLTQRADDINLFFTTLNTEGLAKIWTRIDEIYEEIQANKRDPAILLGPVDDDSEDARWNELKAKLHQDGITLADLESCREQIGTYIRHQIKPRLNYDMRPPATTRPATDRAMPAGSHWKRSEGPERSISHQFVGPGMDSKILRATTGPFEARTPSPVPNLDESQPLGSPFRPPGYPPNRAQNATAETGSEAFLCPYPRCGRSFEEKGFEHFLDVQQHVKHWHEFQGDFPATPSDRGGYRKVNASPRESRTYSTAFAVEESAHSRSCPTPRRDSTCSAQSPSLGLANASWGHMPPPSPMGRSIESVYSYPSSPRPTLGFSLPTPPAKRQPALSTDSYEDLTRPSEAGPVRKRPSIRRAGSRDDNRAASSTSSAPETILFQGVRRNPSLPDLRTLRSSSDHPLRTEPSLERPRASRSQARRFNRRQRAEDTRSKIRFLENTLRQLKDERAFYLEDRDHQKDIIMREILPQIIVRPRSEIQQDKSDFRSV